LVKQQKIDNKILKDENFKANIQQFGHCPLAAGRL
jgi:hypothetical protein